MTVIKLKARAKAKKATASTRKRADWDAIERDYRTGRYTLRELETKHGVFNSSIARKAKNEGWTQDLSAAIRQATNAKLVNQTVDEIASKSAQEVSNVIADAANENISIIIGHRARLAGLVLAVNVAKDLVLTLGSEISGIREAGLFTQAIFNLVTSTRVLLELERKVYNLDSEAERIKPQDAFAVLLDDIASRGSRLPVGGSNDA